MHPSDTPATGSGATPDPTPCTACGASMLPEQDWCLSCGTAAPGRLGRRPGGRTVSAVAAATLLLVLIAVLASYTALTDDANDEAGRAAGASATPLPGQVAQIPDGPAPPAVAPPAATPPATTPPAATTPPSTPPVPAKPFVPSTPVVPGGTPVVPVTPATPGTTTPTRTTGTTTGTTTSTTPAKVTLSPIKLDAGAVDKYDPTTRITASGKPADAQDGNVKTAWSITTPSDGFPMQVGMLIDLEKAMNVKEINLGTTTPGGRVEIYGAVGSAIPDDILDTRWEHVQSTSKVDANDKFGNKKGDDMEKIRLPGPGATGSRFRYVLVWFTTPPTKGPTVRVTEVSLKG